MLPSVSSSRVVDAGERRAPIALWIGWATALAIAAGAAWFDTSLWIGMREPHAFGGRDAGGGAIIAVGMLLAGLAVGLVAWIASALLARALARRGASHVAIALTVLVPLAAIAAGALGS